MGGTGHRRQRRRRGRAFKRTRRSSYARACRSSRLHTPSSNPPPLFFSHAVLSSRRSLPPSRTEHRDKAQRSAKRGGSLLLSRELLSAHQRRDRRLGAYDRAKCALYWASRQAGARELLAPGGSKEECRECHPPPRSSFFRKRGPAAPGRPLGRCGVAIDRPAAPATTHVARLEAACVFPASALARRPLFLLPSLPLCEGETVLLAIAAPPLASQG